MPETAAPPISRRKGLPRPGRAGKILNTASLAMAHATGDISAAPVEIAIAAAA
jgi:hypothetical protein